MKFNKEQAIIESMLFAAGREVSVKEIMNILELGAEDINKIVMNMKSLELSMKWQQLQIILTKMFLIYTVIGLFPKFQIK